MKAVDTNVLVYALAVNSRHHARAYQLISELAQGPSAWAIPWPCIYELLRVVTHPRIYQPPLLPDAALEQVKAIMASPSLTLLAETARHPEVLERVLRQSGVSGNLVHDAHIVSLCIEHGITELITNDHDFGRFSGVRVVYPFTP
ncbi:MAG TPA: TA system VapC family ribonuclease toxin [Terriglobales bacterium]|nr:TA system VapC family ribonuclease toxin [Terriglobales bacterium]